MTGGAVVAGAGMAGRLAAGGDAVVTADAAAAHLRVVDARRRHRGPGHGSGGMTGRAVVARGRVPIALAAGQPAVVAGGAFAQHLLVIDPRRRQWREAGRTLVMTAFAGVAAGNMIRRLAHGGQAIVAAHAAIDDRRMVHVGQYEGQGGMTKLAVVAGGRMPRRLAARPQIIVTVGAGAQRLGVIEPARRQWFPGGRCRRMTGLAGIAGRQVLRRLADGVRIVMTRHATAEQLGVIDGEHRLPAGGAVAGAAVAGGGRMRRGLAVGRHAVVAGDAIGPHDTVIHQRRHGKTLGGMTDAALVDGGNMIDRLARRRHIIMAGVALARCAREHPVGMTGATVHQPVLAGQREGGEIVVEVRGIIAVERGPRRRSHADDKQATQ